MSATIRCFAFAGVIGLPRVGGNDLTLSIVQCIKFPLLGRDLLTVDTVTTDVTDAAAAPHGTAGLWVQVEPVKRIRFEITPEGQTLLTAGSTSPELSGETQLVFGPGWQFSAIEAT